MRPFLILLTSFAIAMVALPARAADTLKVIIVDGDEAANIVAERLAAEPVIEVRDKDDRRVPGAVVRFVIRKTRDRLIASFSNGQAEVRTLTDYSGRASVNAVSPIEPGSFQIDVDVSYRGQTGKAVIRQTNFPTSADAKSAGREPGKSTNPGTSAATAGAATAATTGAAGATTAATTTAVSAGGGMSKLAVIGLITGGAAGAGAAVVLTQRRADTPAGRVGAVTPSVIGGLQAATAFTFSAQATDFDPSSLAYRWEFGDGATSTDASPSHVYAAPGTYTVVLTVSDARQSATSQISVTVFSVTGTWVGTSTSLAGTYTLNLTQSGGDVSGTAAIPSSGGPQFEGCVVSGSVRPGTSTVVLNQPDCRNLVDPRAVLEPVEYRLDLSVDGRTLSGPSVGAVSGNVRVLTLRR